MRDGEPASGRETDSSGAQCAAAPASMRTTIDWQCARIGAIAGTDASALDHLLQLGFDAALADGAVIGAPPGALTADQLDDARIGALARLARKRQVPLLLDVDLHRVGRDCAFAREQPTLFRDIAEPHWPIDPRRDAPVAQLVPRFDHAAAAASVATWLTQMLAHAAAAGVAGFVVHWPQRVPPAILSAIGEGVRTGVRRTVFIGSAPGISAAERRALASAGFDATICSLAWWDYRAPWFADELDELRGFGPVLAAIEWPAGPDHERVARLLRRALDFAAVACGGWLVRGAPPSIFPQMDNARPEQGAAAVLAAANRRTARRGAHARCVSAPWSRIGVWQCAGDAIVLVNSDADHFTAAAGPIADLAMADLALEPAEVRRVETPACAAVQVPPSEDALKKALAAPRVAMENITPAVDDGRFAAKATIGDRVVVEADVFADGHPTLAVRLLWRAADATDWTSVRMGAIGNDRWRAGFRAARLGEYVYTVAAGIDEFAGLRADVEKKVGAGQAVALEIVEARRIIDAAARRAGAESKTALQALSRELAASPDPAARLLAPDCADLMAQAQPPAFTVRAAKTYAVVVERGAAAFAAWYELFPRSQGPPAKHGTFRDVIAQLPRIAAMGFDVLYLPPIHPIGNAQRKGANNALRAKPGEPGSPYAIGGEAGGHDAVHPQLGTLDDFRELVAAAHRHGLEIALDFAIQCSPDHPWIKAHPEWFAWRADGSLRHAENPPKKYEDIVNVDFYAKGAKPALWIALRDVVAFWIAQGVRTFRVDNPHTKPLPFWEWLIADLRALDPGVIFLSEAFTRPRPMYRLAKLGFSQSYTYFTWRHTRAELEAYLTELGTAPVRDFFRPHFFVNTPDINPYFLQTSGRAGFLIRAALAATLSGLWGMYSGFELCESAPLPGREEYLDSEKYQLRHRDWQAPGNIVAEIALLNRIRRRNPALHGQGGLTFYHCDNSNILYFARSTPARDNVLLVAIGLDPFAAHEAAIELPLWEWGLDDNAALIAEDLLAGTTFDWRGKNQRLRIDPATTPYRLWRVRPERER